MSSPDPNTDMVKQGLFFSRSLTYGTTHTCMCRMCEYAMFSNPLALSTTHARGKSTSPTPWLTHDVVNTSESLT